MISYLKGKVLFQREESLTLLTGEVGYEVFCPCPISVGQRVELFIYTHVREDTLQLFGFMSLKQRDIFVQMVRKVSGIGPKVALRILANVNIETLISMICKNEIQALSKLPKLGRKKAEQMVLCLKDSLKTSKLSEKNPLLEEAFSTLNHLGFHRHEIEEALEKVKNQENLQSIVKEALFILNSSKELLWKNKDSLQAR